MRGGLEKVCLRVSDGGEGKGPRGEGGQREMEGLAGGGRAGRGGEEKRRGEKGNSTTTLEMNVIVSQVGKKI